MEININGKWLLEICIQNNTLSSVIHKLTRKSTLRDDVYTILTTFFLINMYVTKLKLPRFKEAQKQKVIIEMIEMKMAFE